VWVVWMVQKRIGGCVAGYCAGAHNLGFGADWGEGWRGCGGMGREGKGLTGCSGFDARASGGGPLCRKARTRA
jgi:hypothetical protein